MNTEYWGRFFLFVMMAFLVNTFIYFSFANVYSSSTLNIKSFENQFQSGIYQYRVLSGFLFVNLHDYILSLQLNYDLFKLKFINKESESAMLLTFFILNTFFFLCSAAVLNALLANKNIRATASEKILTGAVLIFTIGLTQFVMVPYDVSSYFFLLLFFLVLLKYIENESIVYLILLTIIMIISVFNRETAALSLSLAATLLYSKFGISRKSLFPIFILLIVFLAVYIGLRIWNSGFSTNDGNLLVENFSNPKNILGSIFWMVFFILSLFLAKGSTARSKVLLFHLFSLPYIMMCFYSGILYEIRLYVPLLLGSFLIGLLRFPLADYRLK